MENEALSAMLQRQSAAIQAAPPEQKSRWQEQSAEKAQERKAAWDALTPAQQAAEQGTEDLRGKMHAQRDTTPEAPEIR